MAYDEATAARLRSAVTSLAFEPSEKITERRMFGGLCFLLNGNMLAGVAGSLLVFRIDDAELDEALALPYARPMDFTGRPMKNFVYIDPSGFVSDGEFLPWLKKSLRYVRSQQAAAATK